jgi:hypothetical protein
VLLGRVGAIVASLWLATFSSVRAQEAERAASYAGVTATVTAVERSWQPADPTDTPRAGAEFVTIAVRLDNESGRPAEANMFRFTLVTVDGALWRPMAKRQPYIVSDLLPTDESASGWLTFEVPRGAPLAQLLWAPSPDQTVAIDL